MKIVDIGDDHLITYECFDDQFTTRRHCRPDFEHLEVFHRRRQISNQHLQQLLNIISQKTCFSRAELIQANHSSTLQISFRNELSSKLVPYFIPCRPSILAAILNLEIYLVYELYF